MIYYIADSVTGARVIVNIKLDVSLHMLSDPCLVLVAFYFESGYRKLTPALTSVNLTERVAAL